MTHRTVPLDLLVRALDYLDADDDGCACELPEHTLTMPVTICSRCELLAELTAQIEQRGQGEPVAWQYFDAGQWWPTSSIDKYPPNIPTRALYATPQDSVPAWAKELAAKWRYEGLNLECEGWVMLAGRARKCADELESRALALAQGQ